MKNLIRNAIGSTVIASALGLSALGLASTSNAAPAPAPDWYRVHCNVFMDGLYVYSYPGPCR